MAGAVPFLTQRSSIPYFEIPEQSFSIRAHNGPKEAKRVLYVDWPLRDALQSDLLPDVEIGGNYQQNLSAYLAYIDLSQWIDPAFRPHYYYFRKKLLRKNPEQHPRYPDLYAWESSVPQGYGYPESDGDSISYRQNTLDPGTGTGLDGKAKVVVTYKKMPFDHTPDNDWFEASGRTYEIFRYCSVKPKAAGENLPLETSSLWLWIRDNATDIGAASPQRLNRTMERVHFTITWHMVPRVPRAAIWLIGHLNEWPILIPKKNLFGVSNFVCPPGTLLYLNPEISEPYSTFGGREVWDVTYHMIYRPQGWNKFFRPRSTFTYLYRPSVSVGFDRAPYVMPDGSSYVLMGPRASIYPYARLEELWRIDGEEYGGFEILPRIIGGWGAPPPVLAAP